MAKGKNEKSQNYTPLKLLKEITTTISFNNFQYKEYFKELGTLSIKDTDDEQLVINYSGKIKDRRGLVYLMVIGDNIVKIGSTTTTFKKRLGSYNCGRQKFRDNGTCSTTNYFILQTFLNFLKDDEDLEIKIYVFYPPTQNIVAFNENVETVLPPKEYEKILLTKNKPYLCVQT